MITEIAPIDLLLQRLGRLHRHRRPRPQGLEMPSLIVLCDAGRDGLPPDSFGKSIEHVYDRFILLGTWLTLRTREKVEVPTDIEAMVDVVYGELPRDCSNGWITALEQAKIQMEHNRNESEKAADRLLIGRPKAPCDFMEEFNDELADDEDPEVHKTVKASTREGDPSIKVVMLPADVILTADPGISEVHSLLDRSAKLSTNRRLFQWLLENGEQPREWVRSAHLRHARLVRLDGQHRVQIGGYTLTVDEMLGIVIEKDTENHG
jgi:CRISPR-associated endonuclease/helicase Cas3